MEVLATMQIQETYTYTSTHWTEQITDGTNVEFYVTNSNKVLL